MERFHILILDDDRVCLVKMANLLSHHGFKVYSASSHTDAFDILEHHTVDFFFCDISMPGVSGLEILKIVRRKYPFMDVIMISGIRDIEQVIKCFRLGATDYINKPSSLDEIMAAVKRTDTYSQSVVRKVSGTSKWSIIPPGLIRSTGREFIGRSERIKEVFRVALLAAAEKDINVLITGENGTGKEVVARIIHHSSERRDRWFYPINCAAIPETLMESEFFGHKKGTFTGAVEDRKGAFEITDDGTLFLDEISEMPLSHQAKLLRAIEEKKIKPLGSSREIQCNFRIVSATNCEPSRLIEEKKIRIDLYHRLSTFVINIPPLRERLQDITPLTCFFANQISDRRQEERKYIHPDVFPLLKSYSFPGNVRELRNLVERAMMLAGPDNLGPEHFTIENSNGMKPPEQNTVTTDEDPDLNIEEHERKLIINALIQCDYNYTRAAKLLGISRDTLIRKKKKYNINNHDHNQHRNDATSGHA